MRLGHHRRTNHRPLTVPEPRRKSWPLLRNAWLARVAGCLGLAVALPTLGLFATLLVAAIPLTLAINLAPSMAGVAAALSLLLWLATAFGVAWGSLALAGRASSLRLKSGTLLLGEDGLTVKRYFSARFFAWSRVRDITADGDARAVMVELDDRSRQRLLVADPLALIASVRRLRRRWRPRSGPDAAPRAAAWRDAGADQGVATCR
jgi:hypothetical protein